MATLAAAAPVRRETEWSLAVAGAALVIFLVAAPFALYPVFIMKALCFALFACAFNLLIGYVGLVSFGHALYFGWAGYLAAYAAKVWGLPPELAVLAGTATGMALGLIAGVVAIRRQGIYFAMITLALAQMMYLVALRVKMTGGEDGIQGVPRGRLFGTFDLSNEMTMYAFVVVVVLAAFFLSIASSIRRSAKCSRRSAKTNNAPFRSATRPTTTSLWPSCSRPHWPGLPDR